VIPFELNEAPPLPQLKPLMEVRDHDRLRTTGLQVALERLGCVFLTVDQEGLVVNTSQ